MKGHGQRHFPQCHIVEGIVLYFVDTLVPGSNSGTVVVNSEANTLQSELGTMVINEDTEDDDGTMKSERKKLHFDSDYCLLT